MAKKKRALGFDPAVPGFSAKPATPTAPTTRTPATSRRATPTPAPARAKSVQINFRTTADVKQRLERTLDAIRLHIDRKTGIDTVVADALDHYIKTGVPEKVRKELGKVRP